MPHPEFTVGAGTVGTSPRPLGDKHRVYDHVRVKAAAGNSGTLSISFGPTAELYPLAAGEESPRIHIDDVAKVYVRGSAPGQAYKWWAA